MLIEKIKADRILAMKDKDIIRKDLLGTLISESSKNDKVPSDDKVVATIKKFIKNSEECIQISGRVKDIITYVNKIEAEIKILKSYLPMQLDEEKIKFIICRQNEIMKEEAGEQISISFIMKYFKENYSGQYSGDVVSKIAKDILNGKI